MVVEAPIAKLGTLLLEGVLEFNNDLDAVYHIEADYIVIRGGRLIIGWPDEPFLGQASITLRGNHDTPYFVPGEGPDLGSKAIGKKWQHVDTELAWLLRGQHVDSIFIWAMFSIFKKKTKV